MRKPTSKTRRWNCIHARLSNKRRLRLRFKRKGRIRSKQRNWRAFTPGTVRNGTVAILCPSDFSLESNFDGVVGVLEQIRQQSKRQRNERTYIDFREIKTISSSAALVLAAELDRWNHEPLMRNRNAKLRTVDVEEWDSDVRSLLADMGFFDLLQVSGPQVNPAPDGLASRVSFVKFRTGSKVDGKAIEELRKTDLMPFVGVPNRYHLYAAVTEAMTNVVHHAYPSSSRPARPNWWLSASRSVETGEVAIMIYDQGAGIPGTLPRKFPEQLRSLIPESLTKDHARMIQAAHELRRSSTSQDHRGHGLGRDIREYVRSLGRSSRYRIVSLRGEYVLEKSATGPGKDLLKNHSRSLSGTLIEWKLTSEVHT